MISKIKEGWYVAVHLITHLGYDAVKEEFTYTLHGHEYSYQCNKDEGILLAIELEKYIEVGTKLMQQQLALRSPEQKLAEMKANLLANQENG